MTREGQNDTSPLLPGPDAHVDFGRLVPSLNDHRKLEAALHRMEQRQERVAAEREAQARADALARFESYDSSELPGVLVCPMCGALVVAAEQHLDWHGRLNEASRAAHDADARLRPIG